MRISKICLLLLLFGVFGCEQSNREIVRIDQPLGHTEQAKYHNKAAINFLKKGYIDEARLEVKQALQNDSEYGPAFNTLGLIYFKEGLLGDAAKYFSRAASLMPENPAPQFNLGRVWERAGQWNAAIAEYKKALKRDPDNYQVIGNLARALVKQNHNDSFTKNLLNQIILNDPRPEWKTWAEKTRYLMRRIEK